MLSFASSCIYFNTMYNARRLYSEAEEAREESIRTGTDSGRGLKTKYGEVIFKCSKILRDHPESSWVDDAIFLMGKALVRQEEYSKGIRKFQELLTNYPESEYVPHALFWLALAHFEKREYNQALVFTNRFLNNFADHEIRHQVIFLAGDINLELENNEEALKLYSTVSGEDASREILDEALLKSARLHYRFKDWQKAAESYEQLLRKGISWELRYDISLALGDCYSRTGRCEEARNIFDELLPDVPKVKDQGLVMLGQARAYECMDSLLTAIAKYREITGKFSHSTFSAEAYYRLGMIYHEKLDSLQSAEESFASVSREASSSEFAPLAMQKSRSIKKLIELEKSSGKGASEEQIAQARFSAAEIKLTRLDEVESAKNNYMAVIDSFPSTSFAPAASYAVAWIYQKKLGDAQKALEAYRATVLRYPRSQQARGAVAQIVRLGDEDSALMMQAYIDSAMADTAAAAAEVRMRMEKARADSIEAARKMMKDGMTDSTSVRSGKRGMESGTPADPDSKAKLPVDSRKNPVPGPLSRSVAERDSLAGASVSAADSVRKNFSRPPPALIDSLRAASERNRPVDADSLLKNEADSLITGKRKEQD